MSQVLHATAEFVAVSAFLFAIFVLCAVLS